VNNHVFSEGGFVDCIIHQKLTIMKTEISKVYYLLMPFIFILGCKSASTELSDIERNNIIKEVRSVVEEGVVAANKHDADAMMKVHWDSNDYLAVVNGTIIKGWETVHKLVTYVHSNPKNQSFTVSQKEVDIRVINNVTVMVVAEGEFIDVPTKDSTTTEKFALTMLMEKIDDKWVKTIVHESWLSDDVLAE
jgi:uncharacterized protein (TIGR02246 family)